MTRPTASASTAAPKRPPWTARLDQQTDQSSQIARQIKDTYKQIEGLLDKIIESESPTVMRALEKSVEKLETEKLLLDEKQTKSGAPKRSF